MSHCSDDASDHTRMSQSSDDDSGHPAEDAVQDTTPSTGDACNSNRIHSDSTWLSEQLTVLQIANRPQVILKR